MKKSNAVELFWTFATSLLVLILLVTLYSVWLYMADQGVPFVTAVIVLSFLIGSVVYNSIKEYLADDPEDELTMDEYDYKKGYDDAFFGKAYGCSLKKQGNFEKKLTFEQIKPSKKEDDGLILTKDGVKRAYEQGYYDGKNGIEKVVK